MGELVVHAVVRSGWAARFRADAPDEDPPPFRFVEDGDLAAAVTAADETTASDGGTPPASAPDPEDGPLGRHDRVVEALLACRAVVPAPPGFRARDVDAVRTFLDRSRLPLLEALEKVEDCHEARVRARRRAGGTDDDDSGGGPADLFGELRARCRTARRLGTDGDALRAAFLVPRASWDGFVEAAERAAQRRPGLEVDVSGPWAPYAFVRMVRPPDPSTATGSSPPRGAT